MELTDLKNEKRKRIFFDIDLERKYQDSKYGVQNSKINEYGMLAVLMEEVGESAKEFNEFALGNSSRAQFETKLYDELKQVAAVAVAIMERL